MSYCNLDAPHIPNYKWWADRMFLMVPAQTAVAKKLETLKEFPPARGSSLSLGKILDGIKFAKGQ